MTRTAPFSAHAGPASRTSSVPWLPVPRTVAACCYCFKVRGEDGVWRRPGNGFHNHPLTRFQPSVCPRCIGQVREQMGLDEGKDREGPDGLRAIEPCP